jgi:hypothetical protein
MLTAVKIAAGCVEKAGALQSAGMAHTHFDLDQKSRVRSATTTTRMISA